jgi:NADPH:quinone reductase-like Zn-dependent oxidoreductase
MKAIVRDRYGSPDVLALREIERPIVGPDDVLVRVHAAGLDQGVWHFMTGLPYLFRLAGIGLRAPKNPLLGYDLAGRVEAVGGNVTRFRPGDEVFGTGRGSFAEYACARTDRLAPKPASLRFEQVAAVPSPATRPFRQFATTARSGPVSAS